MSETEFRGWKVEFSKAAKKGRDSLPVKFKAIFDLLVKEIEVGGPVRKDWPNYGKLYKGPRIPDNALHCHLNKGQPRYVVCWIVKDKTFKKVEMFYVGTHEKAPY